MTHDELVRELAERMQRADRGDAPPGTADGEPDGGDAVDAVRVDLDTYEAAHEASRWHDEPPPARRRRTR